MVTNEINIGKNFSMRINFNLKSFGGDRSQIWLKTTIKNQRVNIYTKMLIQPEFWIKKGRNEIGERALIGNNLGRVQNNINKQINANLDKILDYCREYARLVTEEDLRGRVKIEHSKENFIDFMKNRINGTNAPFEKSPLDFINEYIERKKEMINQETMRTISSGTIYNHQNALRRLQAFCEDTNRRLVWELFNNRFEEIFTAWMVRKNYSANTIPAQFSIMKVWLSEAEKENFITDSSFHSYRSKCKDVENIYLTEEEIQRIYNLDFTSEEIKSQFNSREHVEITRDLFVLACCTGLRFGDYQNLAEAEISETTIKVYTHKTGEIVIIPILPIVKEILDKYEGHIPSSVHKKNSLRHIRLCAKLAGIDSPTTKTTIKGGRAITKSAPKYEFVMNHTARRSFATNAYKRGIPTLSIMAITGHKTEENFLKYIKVTKEEHAEMLRKGFMGN